MPCRIILYKDIQNLLKESVKPHKIACTDGEEIITQENHM